MKRRSRPALMHNVRRGALPLYESDDPGIVTIESCVQAGFT